MPESVLESPSISPAAESARSLAPAEPGSAVPEAPALPVRRLGDVGQRNVGPTLICLAAVHGNEPSGVLALERIFSAFEADPAGLVGRLVGLMGNRKAYCARRRFLENDLNRHWMPERVARLRRSAGPFYNEDEELLQLDGELQAILEESSGPLYAMDLHTTSGEGPGFAVLDDTLPNREFALHVPITVVVGIEEELSGTVTHHMNELGMRVFGFEAGQHDDPASADHAEAAIWIALEAAGVIEEGARPEVAQARARIEALRGDLPPVVEVRHRHHVEPLDGFRMRPGYINFQTLEAGEVLAEDRRGQVVAAESGRILMPLYQSQGEDGFFIVRPLASAWLRLSALVRSFHAERYLRFFPGVARHPTEAGCYVVDTRWARYLALELFHLLGFRRRGPKGRYLTLYRRPHDD